MAPEYVKQSDVPDAVIQAERDLQLRILKEDEKNAGKPAAILDKIVEGRMSKFYQDIVLMEQEFLIDDSKTVGQALSEVVAKVGESIEVRRFARFALAEAGNIDGNG
jgi:elongation factor Ts